MPDDPRESSFITAAEKQVDSLVKAAHLNKIWTRVLGAVCVVLVVAVGGLGFLYWQQHDVIRKLDAVNVTNCQAGNAFKTGDLENWQLFIQVALGPHPTKDAKGKAAEILQGVAGRDAPRNCSQLSKAVSSGTP